jgi:hypothetical protein
MAHLARRYTQDVAMAADDGDRCRGHRGRNLFARVGRLLEWIEGASDKSQRGLACRRRPALPPCGLSSRDAASASGRFRFGSAVCVGGRSSQRPQRFAAAPYFRPTFVLGVAGPVRRHPIALRPGKGQLSRRISRERTYCTCLRLTRQQARPTRRGHHASHSIHCRPAQGRMADQVR